MEYTTVKRNNTWVFVLVGLIIGTLIGAGVMFYLNKDKDNCEKESTKEIKETTKITETTQEPQKEIKHTVSVINFQPSSVAIAYDGNVYVNVYGSTLEIDNLYGDGAYQSLVESRNKYQSYTFDNVSYLDKNNGLFKGIKLNTSNVSKIYSFAEGQVLSPNYGLILLNNDGTVSGISLYSLIMGKSEVKQIKNLSGIKEFATDSDGAYITYAVKNDGTKVSIKNYLPSDYKAW